MTTATSYIGQVALCVFDNITEQGNPYQFLYPDTRAMKFGAGRFPALPEGDHNVGFNLPAYTPRVGESSIEYGGCGRELSYSGFEWNGSAYAPKFEMGEFDPPGAPVSDFLQGRVTCQEVWNRTSVIELTETAYRHVCTQQPSRSYPIHMRLYDRLRGPHEWDVAAELPTFIAADGYPYDLYEYNAHIIWTRVDPRPPSVMLDARSADAEFVVNTRVEKYVGPQYTSTDPVDLIPGLEALAQTGSSFLLRYHPVDPNHVAFYSYNPVTTSLEEYLLVDDISTRADTSTGCFQVAAWEGSCQVNRGLSPGHTAFARYTALPSIEYVPMGVPDSMSPLRVDEQNMHRLTMDDDAYFFVVGTQTKVASLTVTPALTKLGANHWGTAFFGGSSIPVTIFAKDANNNPLSGVPISVSVSGEDARQIVGYGTSFLTDPRGRVSLTYQPKALVDSIGAKVTEPDIAETSLYNRDWFLPSTTYFSTSDIFVYQILKDDPLVGKAGADTANGEIAWNPTEMNGRKAILYEWNADAIHPILLSTGAYAPVHPSVIDEDNLTLYFNSTLILPDPSTATDTNIGGYWITGPHAMSISAFVNSPIHGTVTNSAVIITQLSTEAIGNHVAPSALLYPYGWRLPDSTYDPASRLGGALYITINPVTGKIPDIYFEGDAIGGEVSHPSVLDIQAYVETAV